MKVVRLGKVDIDLQKFDEAVNKLIPSGFNVNEGEVSAYINGLVDGCISTFTPRVCMYVKIYNSYRFAKLKYLEVIE